MIQGVQLISYPDSLGKNLQELTQALERYFKGCFQGIHILPFYPSSGDRGFAPMDYRRVEKAFGTWEDLESLTARYQVTMDFMANHLSRRSPEFQDLIDRGEESLHWDLFLRVAWVKPQGDFSPEELAQIYTRKPRAPWVEQTLANGAVEKIWCTFSEEQMDLNLRSPQGKAFVKEQLDKLCTRGPAMIRLDAFAYVTKKAGTSCFFLEPETWEILEEIQGILEPHGVELLPEIHEHYSIQQKLAHRGFWVYDFALPMLVLHGLYSGGAERLIHWLNICPRKQVTTLDTHDGIGVVDAADLLTPEEIEFTCQALYERGSNVNRRYSSEEYNNLDIYQINCSFYSALGEDDQAYLLARAIQLFAPGIPQVYYVGLLAGRNDIALLEETKNGRDINRHGFSLEEMDREVKRPVVRKLLELLKLRNRHPAFLGERVVQAFDKGDPGRLVVESRHGDHWVSLEAHLGRREFAIIQS